MSGRMDVPVLDEDQSTPDILEPLEEDLTIGASDGDDSSSVGPESEDDWAVGEDHLERNAWWNEDEESIP